MVVFRPSSQNACQKENERISIIPFLLWQFSPGDKNAATNVANVSATLNGSVNPRGSTTTVYFQWGTTTSYGHTTATQTKTGNTSQPITANISGLSASKLYHFRIVATNGGGTSFGPDRTFTTLSATGPPVVTTNPATNLATTSARLNGSLDPQLGAARYCDTCRNAVNAIFRREAVVVFALHTAMPK
jgi:hypothetical protein